MHTSSGGITNIVKVEVSFQLCCFFLLSCAPFVSICLHSSPILFLLSVVRVLNELFTHGDIFITCRRYKRDFFKWCPSYIFSVNLPSQSLWVPVSRFEFSPFFLKIMQRITTIIAKNVHNFLEMEEAFDIYLISVTLFWQKLNKTNKADNCIYPFDSFNRINSIESLRTKFISFDLVLIVIISGRYLSVFASNTIILNFLFV